MSRQNLDYGRRMNRLRATIAAQHKRVTDLLDIGDLLDAPSRQALRRRAPARRAGARAAGAAAAAAAGRAAGVARRGAQGGDPALPDPAARRGRRADGLCQPRRRPKCASWRRRW